MTEVPSYDTLRTDFNNRVYGAENFELVEDQPKFKVGDRVRRTVPVALRLGHLYAYMNQGREYTVAEVTPYDEIRVTEGSHYWDESKFELVESQPKVGDRVQLTLNVMAVHPNHVTLCPDENRMGSVTMPISRVRVLPPKKVKTLRTFSKDQMVTYKGRHATIEFVTDDKKFVMVKLDDSRRSTVHVNDPRLQYA